MQIAYNSPKALERERSRAIKIKTTECACVCMCLCLLTLVWVTDAYVYEKKVASFVWRKKLKMPKNECTHSYLEKERNKTDELYRRRHHHCHPSKFETSRQNTFRRTFVIIQKLNSWKIWFMIYLPVFRAHHCAGCSRGIFALFGHMLIKQVTHRSWKVI